MSRGFTLVELTVALVVAGLTVTTGCCHVLRLLGDATVTGILLPHRGLGRSGELAIVDARRARQCRGRCERRDRVPWDPNQHAIQRVALDGRRMGGPGVAHHRIPVGTTDPGTGVRSRHRPLWTPYRGGDFSYLGRFGADKPMDLLVAVAHVRSTCSAPLRGIGRSARLRVSDTLIFLVGERG